MSQAPASSPLLRLRSAAGELDVFADASAELRPADARPPLRFGRVGLQEYGGIDNGLCWHRTDRMIGEQYPCRFQGVALDAQRARFTVIDDDGRPRGAFNVRYTLAETHLDIAIEEIDDSLPSLAFPTPLFGATAHVLPIGPGRLVREPLPRFGRKIHLFTGHGLRMRWIGGLTDEQAGHGWMCVFHRGHADAGVLQAGKGYAPIWMRSLGAWRGKRVVRYQVTNNGYVGMAKTFRRWAQDNGLHISLAEKRQSRPHLAHLIGGEKLSILLAFPFRRHVWEDQWLDEPSWSRDRPEGPVVFTSFQQARDLLAEARQHGWRKGLAQLPGWSHGGWDDQFPDSLPPEPALGTLAEFEALLRTGDPHVAGLLDNYADIYPQSPSFPAGIIRRADGTHLRGGIWTGGQCRLLDHRQILAKTRENAAHYAAHGVRAVYCDTTTAVQLYENHDPAHRMTRAEDEAARLDMLRVFRDAGMIVGSERGRDFGVPVVDWSPCANEHRAGETIPLWAMVFGDAHINFATAYPHSIETGPRQMTDDDFTRLRAGLCKLLANGLHLAHVRVTAANWPNVRALLPACDTFRRWMERVGGQEMLRHEYLDAARQIERVTYASGATATVNFSAQPVDVAGRTIPANDFHLEG